MVPSLIAVLFVNTGEAEGKQVVPGIVKSATGLAAIITLLVNVVVLVQPLLLVTESVTVYVPEFG